MKDFQWDYIKYPNEINVKRYILLLWLPLGILLSDKKTLHIEVS